MTFCGILAMVTIASSVSSNGFNYSPTFNPANI